MKIQLFHCLDKSTQINQFEVAWIDQSNSNLWQVREGEWFLFFPEKPLENRGLEGSEAKESINTPFHSKFIL